MDKFCIMPDHFHGIAVRTDHSGTCSHTPLRFVNITLFSLVFGISLLLCLVLPASAYTQDNESCEKIVQQWTEAKYNTSMNIAKEYFKQLEKMNRDVIPFFRIKPVESDSSAAAAYKISRKIKSDFLLQNLYEYKIDNRSIIEAVYEKENTENLEQCLSFYISDGKKTKPLTFPFEVAYIKINKNNGSMPVLLNVGQTCYGSGSVNYLYKLNPDSSLTKITQFYWWQDTIIDFADIDQDGNAEILFATLASFPDDLEKLLGRDKEDSDCLSDRFYRAEIYKWVDNESTRNLSNKFKKIGVKYYSDFPPFLEDAVSIEDGWAKCYEYSRSWIMQENLKMSAQLKTYFTTIESLTEEPETSAVVQGVQLNLKKAKLLGIAPTETYKRYYGSFNTKSFNLKKADKLNLDNNTTMVIASYEDKHGVFLSTLYVHDGTRFRKLKLKTFNEGFEHSRQLIKLGRTAPVMVFTKPISGTVFDDVFFHALPSKQAFMEKLNLHLYKGMMWFQDVDNDGEIEVIAFKSDKAPKGIQKILDANRLGHYALYIHRAIIYKWKNNQFVKLGVKYYSKQENDLPDGLIKKLLSKSE